MPDDKNGLKLKRWFIIFRNELYQEVAAMRIRITIIVILVCIFLFSGCTQKNNFPALKGPYLGQKPPGMKPEIFAPGIISTGYNDRIACFTPDAKELYFMLWGAPVGVLLHMKEKNGTWTKPEVVPFSGKYNGEYTLSPDGKKIAFCTNMPLNGKGKPLNDYYTWIVEKEGDVWGEPEYIEAFEDEEKSFSGNPTIAANGNIYFYSKRKNGMGVEDIFLSRFQYGSYSKPENIGDGVNTEHDEIDPFIAPDESYIIYLRRGDEGFGGLDLFISFKKEDGSWTEGKNMGPDINSSASEYCPTVSPDGRYFFFTSNRSIHKPFAEAPLSYKKKLEILDSPGNGFGDIYWVDAKIFQSLKPVHGPLP